MKKKLILVVKILGFAGVVIWILGLIGFSMLVSINLPYLLSLPIGITATVLQFWFLVTALVSGVYAALKGFNFVGRWEKK